MSQLDRSSIVARLSADLVSALEEGQFSIAYQPQFDAVSRKLVGAESFIRWDHPEFGMVPPLEFIPVAEENGLMMSIGTWILRAVAQQHKHWHSMMRRMERSFRTSVNISAVQLESASFPASVQRLISDLDIDAGSFEIELTEFLQTKPWFSHALKGLKALGLRFSIDDFGTSFSSISVLKRMSVDAIKIDQSLTAQLPHDTQSMAIVQATLAMAKSLAIETIAEGVETAEQAAALTRLSCTTLQGKLFSMPVPALEFETRFFPSLRS